MFDFKVSAGNRLPIPGHYFAKIAANYLRVMSARIGGLQFCTAYTRVWTHCSISNSSDFPSFGKIPGFDESRYVRIRKVSKCLSDLKTRNIQVVELRYDCVRKIYTIASWEEQYNIG